MIANALGCSRRQQLKGQCGRPPVGMEARIAIERFAPACLHNFPLVFIAGCPPRIGVIQATGLGFVMQKRYGRSPQDALAFGPDLEAVIAVTVGHWQRSCIETLLC